MTGNIIMKRLSSIGLVFCVVSAGCTTSGVRTFHEPSVSLAEEALIAKEDDGTLSISFIDTSSNSFVSSRGEILVSVEIPNSARGIWLDAKGFSVNGESLVADFSESTIELNEVSVESVGFPFPPGPDNSTHWRVFSASGSAASNLRDAPAAYKITLDAIQNLSFTRILLGRPTNLDSRIIGAFSPVAKELKGMVIEPGIDYLGTIEAAQRIRIPGGFLAPDALPFDDLVKFGESPFDKKYSNADTEMLRVRPVSPGGTTPVRLIRFANTTKNPIRVQTRGGETLYFNLTARLSPNAESSGFITILPDGTYRSTTSLTPMFEIQRVNENGNPIGLPRYVDTASLPIPGFPFYLASDGGRWTESPPPDRFVTMDSSNFFYDNGSVNRFVHSNGPGGILGSCAKSSVSLVGL